MLVAMRDRESRLLLLTGGMGIMFAGEAVGAAVRAALANAARASSPATVARSTPT